MHESPLQAPEKSTGCHPSLRSLGTWLQLYPEPQLQVPFLVFSPSSTPPHKAASNPLSQVWQRRSASPCRQKATTMPSVIPSPLLLLPRPNLRFSPQRPMARLRLAPREDTTVLLPRRRRRWPKSSGEMQPRELQSMSAFAWSEPKLMVDVQSRCDSRGQGQGSWGG